MNTVSEKERPSAKSAQTIRESRLLKRSDVARETGIPISKLTAIEEDRDVLTRGLLKTLAKHYAVPPYFFYVNDLTLPATSIPDFRSLLTKSTPLHDSLAASVSRASELRDVIAEGWEYVSLPTTQSLPALSQQTDITEAAEQLRGFLKLDERPATSFDTSKLFMDWLRAKAESSGIITIFESLGENDGRGYCIAHDNQIPFLSLNTLNQGPEARLFTLIHELVHIALRSSGVSDPFATRNKLERFCNQVTAEVLMPTAQFLKRASAYHRMQDDNLFVRTMAEYFKVSQQAVALRSEEAGVRPKGFYRRWIAQFTDNPFVQVNPHQEKLIRILKDEGKKKIAKYGTTLPLILFQLFERRFLSALDVQRVSGIKPKYLEITFAAASQRLKELGLDGK